MVFVKSPHVLGVTQSAEYKSIVWSVGRALQRLRGENTTSAALSARLTRMTDKSSLLWLGLAVALVCQGCCQHWSYGLRPGGKRAADSLQHTLRDIIEEMQKLDTSSSPSCNDLSPHITLSSLKEILANLADRENGRRDI